MYFRSPCHFLLLFPAIHAVASAGYNATDEFSIMVNGAPKTLQYRRADGPYELRLAIQNFVSYYGISQGFGCISEACVAGVIEAELRKRSGVCPKSKYLDLLAKSLRGELHTERLRTAVDAALGFNDLWPSLALTMVQQVAKMKSKTHARTRTHTHTHTKAA